MNTSEILHKPFFFILGRPRSGTTLLRFLFDAHPDVCIPLEGKLVLDLYVAYTQIKQWNEESIKTLLSKLIKVDRVDKWGIDLNKLETALGSYISKPEYPLFIRLVYQHYTSQYSKNTPLIFGDKNPTYSLFPDALLKIMPSAKIIYILRDPRDHIISMNKAGLGNGNMIRMAVQWKKSLIDIERIKAQNPDRVLILKYEDLVSDPERNLVNFCQFLEIPYSLDMLNFYLKKDNYTELFKVDGIDERFHSKLFQPITAAHLYRWKTEMNQQEISLIDLCVGKIAAKSGYERSKSKPSVLFRLIKRIQILLTEIKVNRHHRRKNAIIDQYK